MQRTDLDTPFLTIPLSGERTSSRFVRITCSGILIISCTIFGYSQCYAQDVADAARQEQARKQSQQKKSKHVYTDEDLKRAQVLTPEDRAEVEARKLQQPVPGRENAQAPLDAQALPSEEPLGDVARRYRKERELLRLQQSAQFHLPFIEEMVHATPKPSVLAEIKPPVLAAPKPPVSQMGTVISIPAPPREEPFQPPAKRSPFERPRLFFSEPAHVAPSHPAVNHVAPPQSPALSAAPARPSTIPLAPAKPGAPPPVVHLMPPNHTSSSVVPVQPAAPIVHAAPSQTSALPLTHSEPAAPAHDFAARHSSAPAVHVGPAPAAPVVQAAPGHLSVLPVGPVEPSAPKPDLSAMPSPAPAAQVMDAQPVAPVVHAVHGDDPSALRIKPAEPAAPKPDLSVMPSPTTAVRVAPAQPVAPVVNEVTASPSVLAVTPGGPSAPKPDMSAMPSPAHHVRVSPAQPVPPAVLATPAKPSPLGVVPSQPAAPVVPVAPPRVTAPARTAPVAEAKPNMLTVEPGDSLWKLAQKNLGDGLRWHELLSANPAIVDPNHIVAGSHIFLPSINSRFRTATSIIVQKGDTLSGIARTRLGRASYWACIAHANSSIQNANLIYEGQTLVLPVSCKP